MIFRISLSLELRVGPVPDNSRHDENYAWASGTIWIVLSGMRAFLLPKSSHMHPILLPGDDVHSSDISLFLCDPPFRVK